jgi:triphosphatase
MTRNPREVELKLRLPPGNRAILEASSVFAAVSAKQLHQVTRYFDTPDGLLNEAGLTLRVRRTGVTRIQTVKSRAAGRGIASSRHEWEWRIRRDSPDVDRFAKTPKLARIGPQIRGRLEPLFVTDIRRTVRLIHLADRTVIEAAIDEGSIEADTRCEAVSELELELKAGDIAAMYRLAAELQGVAPLWISLESKFARGMQLRTGRPESARQPQTTPLQRHVRAAHAFEHILGETLGHLIANIDPTLRGATEGVHQMRAALRATRATLQLFESHLDGPTVQTFDAQLRHFGQIFGTARDWDVFCLQMLPRATAELPANALRSLKSLAGVRRQAAHVAVLKALRGRDFTALVLELAVWANAAAARPKMHADGCMGTRLRTLVPSLLRPIHRKARNKARHAQHLSAHKLHGLRKSLKKLHCDVESLGSPFGPRAVKTYGDRCQQVLEILGIINDAEVTRRLAENLATHRPSELEKPVGILTRWSQRRGRKARLHLKGALNAFRAAPAFWC